MTIEFWNMWIFLYVFQVGTYGSSQLNLNIGAIKDYDKNGNVLKWPNIRTSQLPDNTTSLRCLADKKMESLYHIEGDLYVIGVVPVHNMGDNPLKCGNIKQGGVDIVEAMRYEVELYSSKSEVKIGLIVIDSCNDPHIIQERILTLHKSGVYTNGRYKEITNRILGYVGGLSNDVSIALADLTTRLNQVLISCSATSSELSSKSVFPYFLRIPSADDKLVNTMINIVKTLQGNYIQILYSESKYGGERRALIKDKLSTETICIANEIRVSTMSDVATIIDELRKEPDAKMVLVLLSSSEVDIILQPLNQGINNDEFMFIASEGWGELDMSTYQNLVGTVVITTKPIKDTGLRTHLFKLNPDDEDANPWLRGYVERVFDCYYKWSYNKTAPRPCM